MATLTETITAVRSIPRSARLAQGHPRIRGFATHVMRVHDERSASRARIGPEPVRAELVARLQRIVDARPELRRLAREAAGLNRHDSCPVGVRYRVRSTQGVEYREPHEFGCGYVKYHWSNCGAYGTVYHPSTRLVSVPAAWLLGRIREMYAEVPNG